MILSISLPARPLDDLTWSREKALALETEGKKIRWELDLGLGQPYFPLDDEFSFQANCLALSTFSKELYPLFREQTEEILLYKGSADFSPLFLWSEKQEENWEVWKKGHPPLREEHAKRLFCADAFVHYFQMLAQHLHDEVPISLSFSAQGCGTRAEKEHLLSQERFRFFTLHFDDLPRFLEAPYAVCFPEEEMCTEELLKKMDLFFEKIGVPFRVISETFLTEEWQGVDFLFVLSEALSPRGRRKLAGFCAAGGNVVVEGKPLGLPSETSWEEYKVLKNT